MAAAFTLFEFLNLNTHIVLKNLRKPGSQERGIPRGWGFDLVSCANYFWESMCWLTFALLSQVTGCKIALYIVYTYFSLFLLLIVDRANVYVGSQEAYQIQKGFQRLSKVGVIFIYNTNCLFRGRKVMFPFIA